MKIKTYVKPDCDRVTSFLKQHNYILSSGKVTAVEYTKGTIILYPSNNLIDSLHNTQKETTDGDSWLIQICHDKYE